MERLSAKLELNGKIYTLQHPGNRAWMELQSDLLNAKTGRIHLAPFLDYCIEHVIFPEKGPKLEMEEIPLSELEVWQSVLPDFLRGELEAGHKWSAVKGAETKKGRRGGAAVPAGGRQGEPVQADKPGGDQEKG